MKKVLSLLLAYVFLQVQTWALSGGPDYSKLTTSASIVGTYAGVMIPQALLTPANATRATSLGLFSLAQPDVGLATGSFVVFVEGTGFTGSISGVIDPEDAQFNGVLNGVSVYQVVTQVPTGVDNQGNTTFTTQRTDVFAQGSVTAEISVNDNVSSSDLTSTVSGFNTSRLTGSAGLDIFGSLNNDGTPNVSNTVHYEVDGFKQADTATATTIQFTQNINTQ